MKVIILIDADNFRNGFINISKSRNQHRYIDFYKINNFIMEYLQNNMQYRELKLKHFRTYFYTGLYTDSLINRMERSLSKVKNEELKKLLENKIAKAKKSKEIQTEFLKRAKNYYFFEIRNKPLQFSPSTLKVFQKGIDVQIAVDLVEFAYKDVFDIAVLLSGDIDLIESVRTIKNLGKHIIILGDESVTSQEIRREADLYINAGRFEDKELDKISHIGKMPYSFDCPNPK